MPSAPIRASPLPGLREETSAGMPPVRSATEETPERWYALARSTQSKSDEVNRQYLPSDSSSCSASGTIPIRTMQPAPDMRLIARASRRTTDSSAGGMSSIATSTSPEERDRTASQATRTILEAASSELHPSRRSRWVTYPSDFARSTAPSKSVVFPMPGSATMPNTVWRPPS